MIDEQNPREWQRMDSHITSVREWIDVAAHDALKAENERLRAEVERLKSTYNRMYSSSLEDQNCELRTERHLLQRRLADAYKTLGKWTDGVFVTNSDVDIFLAELTRDGAKGEL